MQTKRKNLTATVAAALFLTLLAGESALVQPEHAAARLSVECKLHAERATR